MTARSVDAAFLAACAERRSPVRIGQHELADLVRMRHAARLEHEHPAMRSVRRFVEVVISTQVSISDEIAVSVASMLVIPGVRLVKQRRDALGLQVIDHPSEHRLDVALRADGQQIGDRVDHRNGRLERR